MNEDNPLENQLPEVDIDPWVDDDGVIDGEEIQEDLTSIASIAGVFQRHKTNKLLAEQRAARIKEQRRIAAMPDCPYCGGKIPRVGLKVCRSCSREISWFRHICCEPGNEEKTRRKYERNQQLIKEEAEQAEKSRRANIEREKHIGAEEAVSSIGTCMLLSLLLIPAILSFGFMLFWGMTSSYEPGQSGEFTFFQEIEALLLLFALLTFAVSSILGGIGFVFGIMCFYKMGFATVSDSHWEYEKQRFASRCSFWLRPFTIAYEKCRRSDTDQTTKTCDLVGLKYWELLFGSGDDATERSE